MTDKKIIIDGIDVSKCEYCLKMTKYRCTIQRDVYKCLCEENPNCYFKQLKQKEQALDEIENIIKGYCKNMCMAETKETCDGCQNTEILNIINKVKGEINEKS